ncbi:CubicO group peptidase (beta-lactamase class C family) [Agromyces hippuratus]|uniref:CubicO group peptidase (Beta-lactamase class C family) n=2 Tax=Agromyces hippuratus TaxID=286438 RepID=A0A852X9B7_9MICO|nr:serine hydrolase domain-containing protein [Agromyces hippuratus]NYG22465.1 CubicO group peptidase (beta-lactamase class C family) [Agromyces hippuratus]
MSAPETLLGAAAAAMIAPSAGSPAGSPAGCVIGIDLDGERQVAAAGLAAPEHPAPVPMRRGTLHDLASVSKVVGTTTALHRLASMGELDVDDLVTRFVPPFGGHAETSVRDLLQHRAGLQEWQPLYLAPGDDPLATIDALPLRYALRSERHYSDLGFMHLGRVVEAVAGLSLDAAVRDLVARPLGLRSLGYGPVAGEAATSSHGDEAERRMVATGHPYPVAWSDAGFAWRTAPVNGEANDGNCFHAFGGVAGHAGLFGSIDDVLDVVATLSRADERRELWDPEVTADFSAAGPDAEQALGWRRRELVVRGERMPLLWHPGFTGCAVGFVPGRGIAVAFASNRLLAAEPAPTDLHWQRVLDALASTLSTQE